MKYCGCQRWVSTGGYETSCILLFPGEAHIHNGLLLGNRVRYKQNVKRGLMLHSWIH